MPDFYLMRLQIIVELQFRNSSWTFLHIVLTV